MPELQPETLAFESFYDLPESTRPTMVIAEWDDGAEEYDIEISRPLQEPYKFSLTLAEYHALASLIGQSLLPRRRLN